MPIALLLLTSFFGRVAFAEPQPQWTATWGSAQLRPSSTDTPLSTAFQGATLRQVVHLSIGGSALRLHLSNAFGESPLVLRAVQVSLRRCAAPSSIEPGTQTLVTFHGDTRVSIPSGVEYLSDPIAINVLALSDTVITMLVESAPATLTFHAGARATSYLMPGDHTADSHFDAAQTFAHWFFLAGVEVERDPPSSAVVTLGDSITDGRGSTTDGNNRWPDVLARRLSTKGTGVVNQGIGGNHLLLAGLGPNALARFDRDVLGSAGVRFLIVLEGVNDLGELDRLTTHSDEAHEALIKQLQGALEQIARRAHAHGIQVYGATVTPYAGSDYYHPAARSEADRQSLNQWIRTSHTFDAVVDFDALLRDPASPDRLAPAFDSGDHLHPGPAGYQRMGEAIPLDLFN